MAAETEIERLVVRFIGDTAQFEKAVRKVTEDVAKMVRRVGKSTTALGKSLTARITLPLAAIGIAAVKSFADFDKAMIESTSIMDVTQGQTARMRDLALELGSKGVIGPKQLAESYFFLASAGKDAEQSMALLPTVATFATAGAFGMARATDLLTDAQSALGLTSKDVAEDQRNLTKIGNLLVKANTLANASVEQFSIALTTKAGTAMKAFNIDLEDGVALLAAYADQGIKAELAGNATDRVIRLLTKAVAENADQFERLKISVFDDGEFRSFSSIIGDMEKALKGMTTEQRSAELSALGFEARIQQVILPLLGTSDALARYRDELTDVDGVMQKVADKQMKAFSNQMTILKNRIVALLISIGEDLIPTIEKLAEVVKGMIDKWNGLDDGTRKSIVTIGIWLAVLGPGLIVVGGFLQGIGFLAAGYLKLIAVLVKAIPLLKTFITLAVAAKLALIGFAIAGVVFVALKIAGLHKNLKALNDELELNARLTQRVANRQQRGQQQVFADATFLSSDKKQIFFSDEIEKAEKNLQGMQAKLVGNKKKVDDLAFSFKQILNPRGAQKNFENLFDQKGAKANLAASKQAVESQIEFIASMRQQLKQATNESVQKAVNEIGDLAPEGNLESMLKKFKEEADKAFAESEVFQFGDLELDESIRKAVEGLGVDKKQIDKVNQAVNQRQAVTASSAEGRRRIQASIAANFKGDEKKDSENIQAIREGIDAINDRAIEKDSGLNSESLPFEAANFSGIA